MVLAHIADPARLHQVVANLLDNAAKWDTESKRYQGTKSVIATLPDSAGVPNEPAQRGHGRADERGKR